MRPARLLRNVPEKAEAFLSVALLPASDELLISIAFCAWFAAPDQRKASFFQTHHGADQEYFNVSYSRPDVIAVRVRSTDKLCFSFCCFQH